MMYLLGITEAMYSSTANKHGFVDHNRHLSVIVDRHHESNA